MQAHALSANVRNDDSDSQAVFIGRNMDQLVFDFESITHKQCVECKNYIPRCGFHRASKAKDGLQSRCKDCSREAVKKSYRKHREKKIEKCREWRQKNLEKRKE